MCVTVARFVADRQQRYIYYINEGIQQYDSTYLDGTLLLYLRPTTTMVRNNVNGPLTGLWSPACG